MNSTKRLHRGVTIFNDQFHWVNLFRTVVGPRAGMTKVGRMVIYGFEALGKCLLALN
jgi:hypothetical protein